MITVVLTDTNIPFHNLYVHFDAASDWARDHCPSYSHYDDIDVSDVSLEHDVVAEYFFEDEKDAVLFKLRWA